MSVHPDSGRVPGLRFLPMIVALVASAMLVLFDPDVMHRAGAPRRPLHRWRRRLARWTDVSATRRRGAAPPKTRGGR